jgi:hypothetical protein
MGNDVALARNWLLTVDSTLWPLPRSETCEAEEYSLCGASAAFRVATTTQVTSFGADAYRFGPTAITQRETPKDATADAV